MRYPSYTSNRYELHGVIRLLPPQQVAGAPDREVLYMGVPYSRAKNVNGFWYKEEANGSYSLFALQDRVHEVHHALSD